MNSGRASSGPAIPAVAFGSHITALGVIRVLGRDGVPTFLVSRREDMATWSRWYRPLPGEIEELPDPAPLASFLDTLPFDRAVLFPCSDVWAVAMADLPPETKNRFPVTVARRDVLETFVDKAKFADAIERLGIPRPRTIVVRDITDLGAVPEAEDGRFFLKPLNSQLFHQRFGVKAFRPRSGEEARECVVTATREGFHLLLQEYIPGPPTAHHFIDGFVDRGGRLCAAFARRRLRMYPPEFGNSTATVSVEVEEVAGALASLRRLLE